MTKLRYTLLTLLLLLFSNAVMADYPERGNMAREHGKRLTVKEWKTTPDGKNKWEAEYSDFGRSLSWRSEYSYNDKGQLVQEIVYNERNKPSKVRKFEYDSNGVCTRRLNYNANGTLNSYRQFEYSYE